MSYLILIKVILNHPNQLRDPFKGMGNFPTFAHAHYSPTVHIELNSPFEWCAGIFGWQLNA